MDQDKINEIVTRAVFKHTMNKHLRLGQCFMTELYETDIGGYDKVRHYNLDCFYDDSLIESACVVLAEKD